MLDLFAKRAASYRNDTLSGITVALALVPESIAFAFVAGVPPHVGLYSVTKKNEVAFVTREHLDSPLIARALEDERAQLFTWFAQGWIGYRVEEAPDSRTVYLYMDDLRYGGVRDPLQAMWGAQVTFEGQEQHLTDVERVNYRDNQDIGAELAALWRALTRGPGAVSLNAAQ